MEAIASDGYKIKTGDAVLVKDFPNDEWTYTIFSHKRNDEETNYPFITSYCECAYCIPYKGNERLVGTNKTYKSYKNKQKQWVKENNIKINDKIKIIMKSFKNDNGWNNNWIDEMDSYIGKIGIINEINDNNIFIIFDDNRGFSFPYHVLEKVESKFEFKFNAKVNGITSNDINVEGNLIGYNEKDRNTPYLVRTTKSQGHPTNGVMFWCKNIEYI